MKNAKGETQKELPAWLDQIAAGLAILTAAAGLLRILLVRPWSEALNDEALKYFAVAGGLLLLRKVKSISFGDTKVEMQELKQAVETLKEDVTESPSHRAVAEARGDFRALQRWKNDETLRRNFGLDTMSTHAKTARTIRCPWIINRSQMCSQKSVFSWNSKVRTRSKPVPTLQPPAPSRPCRTPSSPM